MTGDAILSVRGLQVDFETNDGVVRAVRGIDLDVFRGETVAIVGESGSGKSQAMMSVVGLLASNGRARGSARYRGQELLGLSHRQLNRVRGEKITMTVDGRPSKLFGNLMLQEGQQIVIRYGR